MAAVLMDVQGSRSVSGRRRSSAHLELYRPGQEVLRVRSRLDSGRVQTRRLDPAVYRRRRLLAVGLLTLALAAVLILVQLIQAGIGGGPLTTTGAAAGPGMIQAGATEYVVHRGDTLWSIAASLDRGGDPRPLVDQLTREVGGASLYPGEVIAVPSRG